MFRQTLSILCGAAALAAISGTAIALPPTAQQAPKDWSRTIAPSPYGGVLIGNPAAATRLVEYISYTCPHCAYFSQTADAPIKRDFIANGSTLVEIRPFLRNGVDYAASMLASCGGAKKYVGNHKAILAAQPQWLGKLETVGAKRQQQWFASDAPSGMAMILADSGLDRVMAKRGYSAQQIAACLADPDKVAAIESGTQDAIALGVPGTPSFSLDGKLLVDTHDWDTLKTAMSAVIASKD